MGTLRTDMTTMTYYDLLQVTPDATDGELRMAYRRMVKRHHPDANPHDRDFASKRFHLIQEAYDLLRDPSRRADYDHALITRQWTSASPYNDNGEKNVSDMFGSARRTIERLMRMMATTRDISMTSGKIQDKKQNG